MYTNIQSLCGDPETNTVLYVNCPSVFKNLILFIYIWPHWILTAAPGLSLVAASWGYAAAVLHGLLTASASLIAKLRL